MLGQALVKTAFEQLGDDLGARLSDVTIIMIVFDVLVVGNVSADRGVSGFADVISRFRVFLVVRPAVHGLLDDLPPEVVVRELALKDGGGGGQGRHDWRPWQEHVVQESRVVYVLRFVSDLETGASHAKVHRVHVDTTWIWLALGRLGQVSILILVNRYLDLHLLLAALVDRLR